MQRPGDNLRIRNKIGKIKHVTESNLLRKSVFSDELSEEDIDALVRTIRDRLLLQRSGKRSYLRLL